MQTQGDLTKDVSTCLLLNGCNTMQHVDMATYHATANAGEAPESGRQWK